MTSRFNDIFGKILNRYYSTVVYKRYYKFVLESEYWPEAKWLDWQWKKLKSLLDYSYNWVPYYRKMFELLAMTPDDVTNWNDFHKLPVLTKEIVQANAGELLTIHSSERKKAITFSSSGSTGKPLSFYTSREQQTVTSAFMDYQWSRIGYKPHNSRVIIRGLFSPVLIEKKAKNIWNITVHGLSEQNLKAIKEFFDMEQPEYIHAFPSSLWTLTNLFLEHGIKLNYIPQGLLLGSEKYPQNYRELFEGFYQCKSYSWLGLAEGTILAGECEYSTNYHVIPGYSFVEFEKNDNSELKNEGLRIIGTSFHNRAFPFIRYFCGDLAIPVKAECKCGRKYQYITSLVGRDFEYFTAHDGSEISLTALYSAIHLNILKGIVDCQFIQKEAGKVEVVIVKDNNFTEQSEHAFIDELNKRSGNRLEFSPVYRDELIKTATGKTKLLIKELGELGNKEL